MASSGDLKARLTVSRYGSYGRDGLMTTRVTVAGYPVESPCYWIYNIIQ
jgi:hypothetical protein